MCEYCSLNYNAYFTLIILAPASLLESIKIDERDELHKQNYNNLIVFTQLLFFSIEKTNFMIDSHTYTSHSIPWSCNQNLGIFSTNRHYWLMLHSWLPPSRVNGEAGPEITTCSDAMSHFPTIAICLVIRVASLNCHYAKTTCN